MKNYSNIYKPNQRNLVKCAKILRNHGICALPTETVYGLAGNAYSIKAIDKIYKLKKRPRKNPLIVHFHNLQSILRETEYNFLLSKIYKKFSPGPVTYVLKLKKNSKISKKLANKNNIFEPANRYFRKIIKLCGSPLAAPSANISNNLSPTSSYDVYDEFKKKIKFILNDKKSKIGLESTVISLVGQPKILRPGQITKNELKKFVKKIINNKSKKILSPGQLKKHYSPGVPVYLNKKKPENKGALLVFGKSNLKGKNVFYLSKKASLIEAARNLYSKLRLIKKSGYKSISITKIPNKNIGIAINDRLKRASS